MPAVAEAVDVEKAVLGPKQQSKEMARRAAIGNAAADINKEVARQRLVEDLVKDSVRHEMAIVAVIEMEREEVANEVEEVEALLAMKLERQCKVLENHRTKAAEEDKEHSMTSRPGSTSTSTERGLFWTGMSPSLWTR